MALDLIALRCKRSKTVVSFLRESDQRGLFDAVEAAGDEPNYSDRLESEPQTSDIGDIDGVEEERSPLQPQLASKLQAEPENLWLGTRQYSVLIVDDDEDNLLYAHYAVEQFGYRVAAASSGSSAIASAFSFCPDIILLDIMLDDISGPDVLKQLRQHKQFEAVPIIAVTALAHDRDREIALEAGFSDYLVKPYMLNDLEKMIKQYLPS